MINLLPEDTKKELGRERLRRFIIVAGFYLSGLIILGTILMLPAYFSLILQRRELLRELDLSRKALRADEVRKVEMVVRELNSRLELVRRGEKEIVRPAGIFEKIIALRPSGVRLEALSSDSSPQGDLIKLSLNGKALTRDDLIVFVQKLEALGIFKKVHSPVSNLLQKTNLEFSLALEMLKP
jgi:hypothetical protein